MTLPRAKLLFLVAGIYGLAVVVPLFFLESKIGELDPPPISHAEFYYGFAWVTVAWQIVYLMMSRDPIRFRPLLIPAVIGKGGFAITTFYLCLVGRLAARNLVLPSTDLVLAALFIWVFVAFSRQPT
jgi:hypothetical protein